MFVLAGSGRQRLARCAVGRMLVALVERRRLSGVTTTTNRPTFDSRPYEHTADTQSTYRVRKKQNDCSLIVVFTIVRYKYRSLIYFIMRSCDILLYPVLNIIRIIRSVLHSAPLYCAYLTSATLSTTSAQARPSAVFSDNHQVIISQKSSHVILLFIERKHGRAAACVRSSLQDGI